MEEYLFKDKLF